MAFIYVPNGIIPSGWWPTGDSNANFQLSETLQPLEKVRDKITLISGLEDLRACTSLFSKKNLYIVNTKGQYAGDDERAPALPQRCDG